MVSIPASFYLSSPQLLPSSSQDWCLLWLLLPGLVFSAHFSRDRKPKIEIKTLALPDEGCSPGWLPNTVCASFLPTVLHPAGIPLPNWSDTWASALHSAWNIVVAEYVIVSFLCSSVPLMGPLLLKCFCPHPAPMNASQERLPHSSALWYIGSIRPPVQVLRSNKNGSSPRALGQCGCCFGGWVCGCRWVWRA